MDSWFVLNNCVRKGKDDSELVGLPPFSDRIWNLDFLSPHDFCYVLLHVWG